MNIHEAGTITGGAEGTHMTLASASERIRGMEDALGAPLLLRHPRGIQLTPAGQTLLHHARLVLRQMERLQGDLGEYGAGIKGHVRLLCNTSALSEHLPQALGRFLLAHPQISVDLEERPSPDIADAVRNDLCDLGLASDSADLNGLQTHPFRADPLVLIVPQGHPLAGKTSVGLAEIVDLTFSGLAEGSALQEHIAQQSRRLGKRLVYRIRLRSFDAVCRMVGQGIGVGIVPKAVARRCQRTAKIKAVALSDTWADRQLVLCARSFENLPVQARQLVEHLLDARRGR